MAYNFDLQKLVDLAFKNFSNGGDAVLDEVRPSYGYKDNQRTDKVNGLKVSVVFPGNHYDTLTVTVADPVDRLSAALEKGDPVHVAFQGFTAKIYVMNGRGGVSAKAESVQIVDDMVDFG